MAWPMWTAPPAGPASSGGSGKARGPRIFRDYVLKYKMGIGRDGKLKKKEGGKKISAAAWLAPYRWIRWRPDAVSTTWLTSPGFSANAASSNSFCMSPLPKKPLQTCRTLASEFIRMPGNMHRAEPHGAMGRYEYGRQALQ